MWDEISTSGVDIMERDTQIRKYFKDNGPTKLPKTDFDSLGIDLEELGLMDDGEDGEDDEMDLVGEQRRQYEPAIEMLCSLSGVS